MGWKSVVVCACLVPVLAGCGELRHAGSRSTGDADRVVLSKAGTPAQTRWSEPAAPAGKGAPTGTEGVVAARRAPAPEVAEKSVPPLPKPELPVIKPFDPPVPPDANAKFVPAVALPDPDLLPVPTVPYPSLAAPAARLPEPAPVAPTPAVPTVLDTIPPIPFQHPPAPPK